MVSVVLGPTPVWSQGAPIKAQVAELLAEEGRVLDSLDGLDRHIVALDSEQARLSFEREERQKKVHRLDEQIREIRTRLDIWKNRLKRRLRARSNLQLDKAVWRRLVLGKGTQNDWLRRRGYLAAVVKADLSLIKGYRRDDRRLADLRPQRVAAVNVVRAKEAELDVKRRKLKSRRDLKSAALGELRNRQHLLRKVLAAQRGRQGRLTVVGNAKPTGILAVRGQLSPPVRGRIIRRFGLHKHVEFGTKTQSNGWVFRARFNEPVQAVFEGTVAYSGWYTGFGNLIIIDHGQGHHSIYAHLNAIHKAKGETVKSGDLIGRVGDTGSLTGPQLYFELRVSRRPVDPARWISRQ